MPGDLPGAAADVQDVAAAAEIEFSLFNQPLPKRLVKRKHTAGGEDRPLGTRINVAHLRTVLVVTDTLDELVFQQAIDDALTAAAHGRLFLLLEHGSLGEAKGM